MNKQEILEEIATLKEKLNNLEKMYDSLTLPNKRWRAEVGEDYYFISAGLCLDRERSTSTDNARYELGNYFETREQAEFEAERLKVIAELREYATPVNEFNWSNDFENKYEINVENNKEGNISLIVDDWHTYQFSDLYFASEELAKNAIESVGEDRIIKYYFRRGEKNGISN